LVDFLGVRGAGALGAAAVEGAGFAAAGGLAGAVAGSAAGFSEMAFTALRHDPDSLEELRWRHCKASMPPGVTLEQFAM
jgi:hypothetical protein